MKKLLSIICGAFIVASCSANKPTPKEVCDLAANQVSHYYAKTVVDQFAYYLSLEAGTKLELSKKDVDYASKHVLKLKTMQAAYNKNKGTYICKYEITLDPSQLLDLPTLKTMIDAFPAYKALFKQAKQQIKQQSNNETITLTVEGIYLDSNNKPLVPENAIKY